MAQIKPEYLERELKRSRCPDANRERARVVAAKIWQIVNP
jgi:hypothetical protein